MPEQTPEINKRPKDAPDHYSWPIADWAFKTLNRPSLRPYPAAPSDPNFSEDYHGWAISDPFRSLEDTTAPATKRWLETQKEFTRQYLSNLPDLTKIKNQIDAIYALPTSSLATRCGESYFQWRNSGGEEMRRLFIMNSPNDIGREVLNENTLSQDMSQAVIGQAVSRQTSHIAYQVSKSGGDWTEIRVREIATGHDLADVIKGVKFSEIAWDREGKGFYYSRYLGDFENSFASNTNHKVYYHALGTDQTEDRLIYERPDAPLYRFTAQVTQDGRYLVVEEHLGSDRRVGIIVKDLENNSEFKRLCPELDAEYGVVGNQEDKFFVLTNKDSPLRKLVMIDLQSPEAASFVEIIPESEHKLYGVAISQSKIVAHYLENVSSKLEVFSIQGKHQGNLTLPFLGSVGQISASRDSDEVLLDFSSFVNAPTSYSIDFSNMKIIKIADAEVEELSDKVVVSQKWYKSKDGTEIPMFIVHRQGLELDGNNPTCQMGYGGFAISRRPEYIPWAKFWIDNGGVLAMPAIRGGGEFGAKWHQAGMLLNKQNVFDDFIAASEALIDWGYTSSRKLAIAGGSNGGLLVAACMIQRPELYSAVVPAVAVLDMLRYHLFSDGKNWIAEYGSVGDKQQFENLLSYSPLHNLKQGVSYPATMLTVGENDNRVVPVHSYKFVAALQEAQGGWAPCIIRIDENCGHGQGKPRNKVIAEVVDRCAFVAQNLGMEIQ